MPDNGMAFALLAAGSSRRFGGGKLAVEIAGKALIRWASDAATRAGFGTRLLVVGGPAPSDFGLAAEGWTILVNSDAASGIGSSIRTAAACDRVCSRLVIGLADMPFVSAGHYRALASSTGTMFTRYPSGHRGVPAAFDESGIRRLASLMGDQGAHALDWSGASAIPPPSPHDLLDVDTPKDLAIARSRALRGEALSGDCGQLFD